MLAPFERSEGELLEVYSRIRTPNGTPVLFEQYERFDSVVASGRRLWLSFLPAILADDIRAECRDKDLAAMARAGFAWLTVDIEHSLVDWETATHMFASIADAGCTALARVPANRHDHIKRVLDSGAAYIELIKEPVV